MKKNQATKATTIASGATNTGAAEVIQAAATTSAAAVVEAPSKASKANAIFARMFAEPQVPARKDMIAAAVQQAGLTPAGAATYLQNYKAKNGLTKPKAAPVAAAAAEPAMA